MTTAVFLICLLGAVLQGGGWFRTGEDIWRSGTVADGGECELKYQDITEDSFMFFWRVSSEEGYDCLEIEADGRTVMTASGTDESWRYFAGEFSEKGILHTLVFRYRKDLSGRDGEDGAAIYGLSLGSWVNSGNAGDWRFTAAGGRAMLTGYSGAGGRVVIPGIVSGFPVAGILRSPFPPGISVSELYLEVGLQFLGDEVFRGLNQIQKLCLPSTLHFLGKGCFQDCRRLEEISYAGDFLAAGERVFKNCAALRRVDFSECLGEISASAFWGCSSLRNFVIPEGICCVRTSAFSGSGLRSIHLPASCAVLEERALMNCPELAEISVASGSGFFSVRDGVLFNREQTRLILYPAGRPDTVWQMPDTVRMLAPYSFFGNGFLQTIRMNRSLEIIPPHCFQNCQRLEEMLLPEMLRSIGREAMAGCPALRFLHFPRSLESVGEMAFWGCSSLKRLEFDGACPVFPENSGLEAAVFSVWRGMGWEAFPPPAGVALELRGQMPAAVPESGNQEILFSGQHLVELKTDDEKIEWYYTLDGREPDPAAGTCYRGIFPVDRTCWMRYRGFAGGKPVSAEKSVMLVEFSNLPEEAEDLFLTVESGTDECIIEKYLGRRRAFRIPERIGSLRCTGVASGAFSGAEDCLLLEFPDSLCWLDLEEMPERAVISLASGEVEIHGGNGHGRIICRNSGGRCLFLQKGWNLQVFSGDVLLEACPYLARLRPLVQQGQIICLAGKRIVAGEGVWIWSPRDQAVPFGLEKKTRSLRQNNACWRLGSFPRGKMPGVLFVWKNGRRWHRLERYGDCEGISGMGKRDCISRK